MTSRILKEPLMQLSPLGKEKQAIFTRKSFENSLLYQRGPLVAKLSIMLAKEEVR